MPKMKNKPKSMRSRGAMAYDSWVSQPKNKDGRKAFFVHIPKTAGSSIRKGLTGKLLTNPGIKKCQREHHFAKRRAKRLLNSHPSYTTDSFPCYLDCDEYINAAFSFSVIRNPYDLLVSYYFHSPIRKKNKPKTAHIDDGWANVNGYHNFKSFESFIDFYCNSEPEEWHVPELSRCLFSPIFKDSGESAVDYVVYFENIKQGISVVFQDNNIPARGNIEHINKSPKRKGASYKDFYSNKMIKDVEIKCHDILEAFEYGFGKEINKEENFFARNMRGLILK